MSRRREAAELARVLALSTQQTRDIAEISPHSLSSGHAGATQDSRDMELKMLQPMDQASTGLSEDEVALFSSRSVEDEANQSRIQNFNPHEVLQDSFAHESPSHYREMPAPLAYVRRDPNGAATDNTAKVLSSGPSSGHLSPTQLSARASELGKPNPIGEDQDVPINQQRPPLRPKASNQAFQLSSSPEEPTSNFRNPIKAANSPIDILSDPEEIEIIERPTPVSKRRRPEIILQSKSAPRASRHDSPDPLDLIPVRSGDTVPLVERRSTQPRSSATDFTNVGTERKSSRVKAAADKKELEKEEKRRLRRERKDREEAERFAKGVPDQVSKSRRQKPDAPAATAKSITYSGASIRDSRQASKASPATPAPTGRTASRSPPAQPTPQRSTGRRDAKVELPIAVTPAEEAVLTPPIEIAVTNLVDEEPMPPKSLDMNTLSPETTVPGSSVNAARSKSPMPDPRRRELAASASSSRQSPGPAGPDGRPQRPDGIRWQTTRNDLSGVLAKFGGAKPTGMSKRHRIAPLHAKIGPPAKALPPVPQKPVKRKKGDESDEDESEEGGSEDEHGVRKPKSKVKGMDWFMVED